MTTTKQPGDVENEGEKRPAENPAEPAARRLRRDWLAAPTGGRRQPRIGSEFQVSILPSPSDFSATSSDGMEVKPDE